MIRSGWRPLVCLACLACLSLPLAGQIDCSSYNVSGRAAQQIASDPKALEHVTGNHSVSMIPQYSCTYTDQNYTNQCASSCSAATSPDDGTVETGVVNITVQHGVNEGSVDGSAGGNGPTITCGTEMNGAVKSCLPVIPCNISVSITGSVNGIGGSVTFSAAPLWNKTLTYPQTCGARMQQPAACPLPTAPKPYGPNGEWVWDTGDCQWDAGTCGTNNINLNDDPDCGDSPILIDTNGEGFRLTSVRDGVKFDFFGTGTPIQIAWTAPGSKNGWLALPEADGSIRSARDLFGNITAQPIVSDHERNGFAALSIWDSPSVGGNGNGEIDQHDAVWGKLRVWIDDNHNGVAEANELHTLDEFGIASIDLKYRIHRYVDQYGNEFRYKRQTQTREPE